MLSHGLGTIAVDMLAIEIAPVCVQPPGGTNICTPRSISQGIRRFLHRTKFNHVVELQEDKSSSNMPKDSLSNAQT